MTDSQGGRPATNHAGASDSPTPSRNHLRTQAKWARWLGIMLFVGAAAGGFFWKNQILSHARALIPSPHAGRPVLYWTSPMDPTVHSSQPGKDRMGMELVPVYAGQQGLPEPHVIDPVLTERVFATTKVENGPLVRTIHTVGTIEYAEPRVGDVTLKIDGWLEKLYVDYEGQPVHRGDPMFELYSPELVTTQQELLISLEALAQAKQTNNAAIMQGAEQNVQTARRRLQFWDVTDKQIDDLARTGKVRKSLVFYAPFDGIVVEKNAFQGKYLAAGQLLYRIVNLSKIWVHVFAYQNQVHCVYDGQGATLRLANLPGREFHGQVIYIYPYLDPINRAVKVRLEFDNPDLTLKPGMFADIVLEPHAIGTGIKVRQTAILQTGERSLVFLSEADDKFRAQGVTTGMELDDGMVEIRTGLREGQELVAEPSFLMDSESRLRATVRRFSPAPHWTKQTRPPKMPGM